MLTVPELRTAAPWLAPEQFRSRAEFSRNFAAAEIVVSILFLFPRCCDLESTVIRNFASREIHLLESRRLIQQMSHPDLHPCPWVSNITSTNQRVVISSRWEPSPAFFLSGARKSFARNTRLVISVWRLIGILHRNFR